MASKATRSCHCFAHWGSIQRWKPSSANFSLGACLDVYVVTPDPDRVSPICIMMQNELWVHACVHIVGGGTQVWNAAGQKLGVCDAMVQVVRGLDKDKARRCSEPPWVILIFVAAQLDCPNILTSNRRGFCCSIVQVRGQTMCCACCFPTGF